MKRLIFLWLLALAGCAAAPVNDPQTLLADSLFPPPASPIRSSDVFAASPAMRDYARRLTSGRLRGPGARDALMEALQRDIKLEYDAATTRTAAEAFAARSGNCLSLLLMTAALAHELDIPIVYQTVYGEDTWTRTGGFVFHSGHVNLVLGTARLGEWLGTHLDNAMIVDFLPSNQISRHVMRPISEATVTAMYFNNRAAEALADGEVGQAYWLAREAIHAQPGFVPAVNTLGVVYHRHGDLAESERTLRYAADRERENPQILSNLAAVLADEGKSDDAQVLRAHLAEIEPYPPFHFLDLGMQAMQRGDDDGALVLFKREMARMPYDDEVEFAMAIVNLRRGDVRHAEQYLALAAENTTTRERRNIYEAKLRYLKSLDGISRDGLRHGSGM